MKKIAYFGGTFDPVHNGHLSIGRALTAQFDLDKFFFMPAFHAPHKPDRPPTSAYHRYAMLCLATNNDAALTVSTLELDRREKRYTIDTLPELHARHPQDKVFFVMGADSWNDILTWREWERVLLSSDHIVITRPGHDLQTSHVSDAVRERVIDMPLGKDGGTKKIKTDNSAKNIYFSDAVYLDASATKLRSDLSDGTLDNVKDLPPEVAKYIEKYDLYI